MTAPPVSNTEFIKKIREITLVNISNEKFGVNELASATGLNYYSLNRKLHSSVKKTTSQFINEIRLEKAKEILEQGDHLTASEVSYRVGFGSPAYFNRCFHEHFGYPPGEIKKRGLNEWTENSNESALSPKTEEEAPTNLHEQQPVPKKLSRKGTALTFAGILILAIVSWLFFYPLFKKSEILLKPSDKSIAVLPFKNLSNDPNNQYFADGVMEDILNLLYRIREFKLVSRTSVEQFRGSTKSVPDIAKKLGVNFILEGSVQRDGEKVRVNIQLIDARHDQQIFSEKYDREFADIFDIQSSIAKQVADQLQAVLSPDEIAVIDKISTKNTEAYNLYLKGRFYWNRRTEEGVKKSIEYFNEAIEIDPHYALAWAGLADAYNILAGFGWYKPWQEGQAKAKNYTLKALELDRNLAEAHTSLGFILSYKEWNWKEAEKELTEAIRLNPNYTFARQIYTQLLDIIGEADKAREQIDLALKIDPLSFALHGQSARLYYNEENFKEALKEYQEMLSIDQNYKNAYRQNFLIYYRMGEGDRALDELKKLLELDTITSKYVTVAESVYAESGLSGLIDLLIEIKTTHSERIINVGSLASLYAISGKKEEALTCIEGYLKDDPGGSLVRLINMLDYESLRSEPRFKAVVDKLGLTEYYLKRVKDADYIKNP